MKKTKSISYCNRTGGLPTRFFAATERAEKVSSLINYTGVSTILACAEVSHTTINNKYNVKFNIINYLIGCIITLNIIFNLYFLTMG